MSSVEHLPPIETKAKPRWQRYLLETFLAFAGVMLVTGIIYTFHLYPRIPNISIIYLLVVMALASTRGRYAAILASVVAFLAFDFFLVPPLYVFTINRIEEWIALFVFLVTAILTSQLAVTLRQRAEQASRRAREARILYELVRATKSEEVVGVLRLRLQGETQRFTTEERLEEEREHPNARTAFFWTFLDQATSVIERARLRRENMRIEILQRTDELRAALLSSVSHDLRTPLSSIKAAASSLLQEDVQWDDEARRSFALTIEREAVRLNRLVSNLLDMSRFEGGALRPEKEWYSLNELIREVLGRLQPLLQGRSVRAHLPDDLQPVELDYSQMDQVLTNLIENAARYTPPESPIDVSVHSEGEQVIISVADRGPGIPPGDLERVFDKFYRVLPSRQGVKYPTGSGLGLAVSKGLVEAHGGRIWAENREGGGAVFSVALPAGKMEGIPT